MLRDFFQSVRNAPSSFHMIEIHFSMILLCFSFTTHQGTVEKPTTSHLISPLENCGL
jgi:hypothetical protein